MKIAVFPYAQSYDNEYTTIKQKIISEFGEFSDYKKLRKEWKELLDIDVIMVDWIENYFEKEDYIILLLARLLKKKVIWTFHNKRPHEIKNEKYAWIYRYLIFISSHIVIHSKNSISCLKEYFPFINKRKVHYVPHPNYIDAYKKSDLDVRKKYNIKESEFVFLFYGSVRPYKNIEMLLEAFSGINNENVKLLIAGSPYNADYVRKISGLIGPNHNVVFDLRYIPNEEIHAYLDAADVVVLPYCMQSSMNSGALILAFSSGRAVIVPNIEMVKDIAKYDVVYNYGYKSEDEHLHRLKENMERAVKDGRENVRRKGKRALKLAQRYYSLEKMRNGYNKIFNGQR